MYIHNSLNVFTNSLSHFWYQFQLNYWHYQVNKSQLLTLSPVNLVAGMENINGTEVPSGLTASKLYQGLRKKRDEEFKASGTIYGVLESGVDTGIRFLWVKNESRSFCVKAIATIDDMALPANNYSIPESTAASLYLSWRDSKRFQSENFTRIF